VYLPGIEQVVKKIEENILSPVFFFFFENHTVYELMWKNIAELSRSQMKIRRMRFA